LDDFLRGIEEKTVAQDALARAAEVVSRVRLMELAREYKAYKAELLAACEQVLDRMQLLGGDELKGFEREMAAYLGVGHVRGVASGTDALRMAARAAGVEPGDEVLIQANAFMAAVEALIDVGARPVAVDIRLDDLGPDLDDLAARVTTKTRALLVVHLYGFPVDLDPLVRFARDRDLILLEDCSHAHGARYDGRRVGSFGAAGAFSLGVVKNLAAYGDAGMVSTDDATIADTVKLLGTHGQLKKNEHVLYGGNSRLDELQAGMLRVKLRHLDARNARRAAIAAHYTERLRGRVVPPPSDVRRTHVHHQYVIRTQRREALRQYLANADIEAGIHYPTPIHRQTAWTERFGDPDALPRAEQVSREILSLPVHADLSDAEVERVAETVRRFFA
jgi:dTDP-4-amino-4,6-dideoxygalactose transaminase